MDEEEIGKNKFGDLYLVKVFKSLGLMHIIVFITMILCDIIVLLPAHIKWAVDMVGKLINMLSGGNEDYKAFYWAFLIATLSTLVIIWVVTKILVVRKNKKLSNTYSLTQEQ